VSGECSVAIIGYGRFGQAFGRRLAETGVRVRAWDERAAVADEFVTGSLPEALDGADYVVLAVPIASTKTVILQIRPYLKSEQLVMDVGSVKTSPAAVMQDMLGAEIPWLATHPLFGPTSLALGERPLRVVLCPNRMHTGALARCAQLYERIGCEVFEQDAEAHDQAMAQGHALAYFVAKGFLDAGVDLEVPLAPPSVQAIGRTVRAVQEDAAHLFASLHRENPYAPEMRNRLLEALTKVDEALRAPPLAEEQAHHETGALHIEELRETPPALREARDIIDEIDRELLELLESRAQVSVRAAQAKADVGRSVRDPQREASLIEARRESASRMGLDPALVEDIFHAVLRFSRHFQSEHAP
jgi:prephenate dehydrogenase